MDVIIFTTVAIFNLVLGAVVLYKGPRNRINVSFSIVVFSLAFWVATWAITFWVKDEAAKLFWTRMMLAGPSITPTAFVYFSYVFPKLDVKLNKLLIWIFLVIPSVILVAAVPSGFYIASVKAAPWGIDFVPGPGYLLNSIFFVAYLGFAFIRLAIKFRKIRGFDRERMKYLFLGTFIAASIGLLVNFILPLVGFTQFNKFGPIGTTVIVAFTAYAIVEHRLMDISVIVSRTVAEFLAIIFHGTIYMTLVWFYRTYVSAGIDPLFLLWTVLYGILVGNTHQGLRLFFQTTSDKVFLHGRYDYYRALSDASSHVGEKLSLPDILKVLYETFHDVVEISNPRVFLPEYFAESEKTSTRYLVYDKEIFLPQKESQAIEFDDPLVKSLIAGREPAFEVKELNAALVVPCLLEERLIAFFALGAKLSEDPYTNEDLRLLKILANQVAITLDHSRSFEKIRADLEVAERQLERSQRLASLGTLIAGVTHEIRNPLTVIRSETERLANEVRDMDYLRQHRELLLKHIDRITGIVQRMLNLAREKPQQRTDVNLNDVIDCVLLLFPISRISLKKELKPIPSIKGDPEGLQEVFVNLIQNAIEAMPQGGTLTLRTYSEDHRVAAEVSDTGRGIPEEIRERIFDPFFSTRHEGVGLGLSIAYRIIREHGGDIKVLSEAGKGTTFKILF